MTKKRVRGTPHFSGSSVPPLQGNLVAGGGAAAGNSLLPGGDLHGPILLQILVHVEGLEQQVRLMAHALS
jgi:hypothetical protein